MRACLGYCNVLGYDVEIGLCCLRGFVLFDFVRLVSGRFVWGGSVGFEFLDFAYTGWVYMSTLCAFCV